MVVIVDKINAKLEDEIIYWNVDDDISRWMMNTV